MVTKFNKDFGGGGLVAKKKKKKILSLFKNKYHFSNLFTVFNSRMCLDKEDVIELLSQIDFFA